MRRERRAVVAGACVLGAALIGGAWWASRRAIRTDASVRMDAAVRELCSRCHLFPPPDVLPRFQWRDTVAEMYAMPAMRATTGTASRDPPQAEVAAWFEARAPEALPLLRGAPVDEAYARRFVRHAFAPRGAPPLPGAANVQLVDVDGDARLELVVCDARHGYVFLGRPYEASGDLVPIAGAAEKSARAPFFPVHAEACDLDGDGRRDLVVAQIGSLAPKDCRDGSVVWLRARASGGYQSIPIATGLGRVAEAMPFDANGDGKLDIAVAEFGHRETGRVLVLENRSAPGKMPAFVEHVLDERHGAINVRIADLDGDGRPDVVAVLAQEHEMVVAYLNRGGFSFEPKVLYRAPHPAWGSSGLSLVDVDGDGRLDALVTNGDTLDDHDLKPYHGIRWLQRGPGAGLDFAERPIAPMYGVDRAEAADLFGSGRRDVVACSFLPHFERDSIRAPLAIPSLVLFEQTAPGAFEPHVLESLDADHPTLALGDYDLDGDVDIAVGNLTIGPPGSSPLRAWVEVWENRTK